MSKEPLIRTPQHQPHEIAYDADCQEALTSHLEKLLDDTEAAGWDRGRAASALMYLSAKRLKASP